MLRVRGAAPVAVGLGPSIRDLPQGFLSVSIDMSQLLGGLWWEGSQEIVRGFGTKATAPVDFSDERLIAWTEPFAGGVLRLGGTASDKVRYDVQSHRPAGETREHLVLRGDDWKAVSRFCRRTGLSLMMTLNCGKDTWDSEGSWDPRNASELLRFDAELPEPATVWALGNEINGYPFVHGLGHFLRTRRYCRAYATFSELVRETHPEAKRAGPASAFWPVVGEPNPKIRPFLRCVGDRCEVLTWHYYPMHSHRGSFSTRWASPKHVMSARTWDELGRYSRRLARLQERMGFRGERWLGELGPALYGGEPGLSDRFISSLWWLDALGGAAAAGEARVARQTLFGSEYGLLRSGTYEPNPDYWVSLLWRRLMGPAVHRVEATGAPAHLRIYAHRDPARGVGTLLAINASSEAAARLNLQGFLGSGPARLYHLSAPEPLAREVRINGVEPGQELFAGSAPQAAPGRGAESRIPDALASLATPLVREELRLEPLTACFVVSLTTPELPPD